MCILHAKHCVAVSIYGIWQINYENHNAHKWRMKKSMWIRVAHNGKVIFIVSKWNSWWNWIRLPQIYDEYFHIQVFAVNAITRQKFNNFWKFEKFQQTLLLLPSLFRLLLWDLSSVLHIHSLEYCNIEIIIFYIILLTSLRSIYQLKIILSSPQSSLHF